MEIVLLKSPRFDEIIAQENAPGRGAGGDAEDLASQLQGAPRSCPHALKSKSSSLGVSQLA
jgi:hypothetical protein